MKNLALLVIICVLAFSLSACFAPRPLKRVPGHPPVVVKPPVKPPIVRP